ncbi:hypothetical protein HMPREF1508_1204 [Shuttleworthella sp. MSX8B]|nr:hypothetical protein HMPREF1508_1204 [Shuttleworthia sp. MSX8B]
MHLTSHFRRAYRSQSMNLCAPISLHSPHQYSTKKEPPQEMIPGGLPKKLTKGVPLLS